MRTTIEMKDEHRAALLELAARRGEKGFSSLVSEAVEQYLASAKRSDEVRRGALALRGVLGTSDERALRKDVAAIRERWR